MTKKKALAYRNASRKGKPRVLDELVELTGWHRDYARAALRDALVLKIVKPRPRRSLVYGPELLLALIRCWAVLRAPAGRLLAPMLPVLVPLLRAEQELMISDEQAVLLARMSAATIDRKLSGERAKLIHHGRSHTKPGTLLKSQIPIRTWVNTGPSQSVDGSPWLEQDVRWRVFDSLLGRASGLHVGGHSSGSWLPVSNRGSQLPSS